MTKKLFVFIFLVSSLWALNFELVEDTSKPKDPNNNFFMKDNRKVYRAMKPVVIKAMEPNVIKAMEPVVIKAMKTPVILAFEVEGKAVAVKAKQQKPIVSQKPQVKKEDIQKHFTSKEQLVAKELVKEKVKVSNESADFFESLNKEDNKPIDME